MKYLVVYSTNCEDIYYDFFLTKANAQKYVDEEIYNYKAYIFPVEDCDIDRIMDRT